MKTLTILLVTLAAFAAGWLAGRRSFVCSPEPSL